MITIQNMVLLSFYGICIGSWVTVKGQVSHSGQLGTMVKLSHGHLVIFMWWVNCLVERIGFRVGVSDGLKVTVFNGYNVCYNCYLGNSADQLRMPRICCLFSCWISSRSRHAELVCTITCYSLDFCQWRVDHRQDNELHGRRCKHLCDRISIR